MPDPIDNPDPVMTPPIDLPVPTQPAVPWFDGEHWHWATFTIVGHVLTCADNQQILFAAPGIGVMAKPPDGKP